MYRIRGRLASLNILTIVVIVNIMTLQVTGQHHTRRSKRSEHTYSCAHKMPILIESRQQECQSFALIPHKVQFALCLLANRDP